MFDDRLEIWSPGKLPPPITLERLGYDQFSRNNVIARVLVELGYIEEVGLGIRRMREEMASFGLPEPEFREDGFSFVITFRSIAPREGFVTTADAFRAVLERGKINERQYKGLLYAQEHGTIARREYVALTGVSERAGASSGTTRAFRRSWSSHPTTRPRSASPGGACGHRGAGVSALLLLTCEWRLADPRNPYGLLGPVWREPDAAFHDRRFWPLHPSDLLVTRARVCPLRPSAGEA